MKKRILLCTMVFCLVISTLMVHASGTSYSITLPRAKGDVTLKSAHKACDADVAYNEITYIGADYDCVRVWIERKEDGKWSRVSDRQLNYEGEDYTIESNDDLYEGDYVRLRGDNDDWTTVRVSLRGVADLQ